MPTCMLHVHACRHVVSLTCVCIYCTYVHAPTHQHPCFHLEQFLRYFDDPILHSSSPVLHSTHSSAVNSHTLEQLWACKTLTVYSSNSRIATDYYTPLETSRLFSLSSFFCDCATLTPSRSVDAELFVVDSVPLLNDTNNFTVTVVSSFEHNPWNFASGNTTFIQTRT